ncbi:MAG: SRPBCC family protein [Actinobacteria bacterium]|nr:SRPBCC family protein [Actinomycetota bacterium]
MASNILSISLSIKAPREQVWSRIADWNSQGDWMLQTKVWVTSEKVSGIGTTIAAFTGPLYKFYPRIKSPGLLDLMTVTRWDVPSRCDVEHNGKILKGSGSFILTEESPRSTRFDWSETVIAPRALFLLVVPFLYAGVRISLSKFARSFH